jgi:hypothetical protein
MPDDYRECAKSMLACVWALSLFGAEQLVRVLAPREALTPRYITKLTFEMMQQSAEICGFLMPGRENRLAWQELRNKLQAFDLFEHADVILHIPPGPAMPLTALVERAAGLEPYVAVWAMEGLGRYYAEACWEHAGAPQHLLTADRVRALPSQSLIPLHTGLGLSLASRLLATLRPRSPESDIDAVLQQFVALCQQNATAGHAGAALEALGLVTRLCYPQMVRTIDSRLSVVAPDMVGYFWHGVGRGLYFLPLHALPCSGATWRAIEMTQGEAPHALGRLNALAGLAWAITLVNIRHPTVLEAYIQRCGEVLCANDAFSSGVSTALMIWYDMAGADPYLRDFIHHQPDAANPRLVQLWHSQVRGPAQEALQRYYGVLKARHGLGEVFCYQPPPALVGRLVGNRCDA